MMSFWTNEKPVGCESLDPYIDSRSIEDDFDDILATRTKTSWENEIDDVLAARTRRSWEEEEVFEEANNDVSPDNSVGFPDVIEEESEDDIQVNVCQDPEGACFLALFPWPFNDPEQDAHMEVIPTQYSEPKPSLLERASFEASKIEASHTPSDNVESKEADMGEATPFDERIPPSNGVEVPFDNCPLVAKEISSVELAGSTLEAVVPEREGDDLFVLSPIKEDGSDASKSPKNKSLEYVEEEGGVSAKENVVSKEVPFTRDPYEISVNQNPGPTHTSIDNLVTNLEAIARRLDELSDKQEGKRLCVLSPMKEGEPIATKRSMKEESFEDTEEEDGLSDKENDELVEGQNPEPMRTSIDNMVTYLEALAQRLDTLSDDIQECRSMESASFSASQINKNVLTKSLLLKNMSLERDNGTRPESRMGEVEECSPEDECLVPTLRVSKMFHPPSASNRSSEIKRDADDLADPPFDEIQDMHTMEWTNSIIKGAPTTSHEDEASITTTSILKTATSEGHSMATPMKKVNFSEDISEIHSSGSDLAFDYMRHSFDEDSRRARLVSEDCDDSFAEYYDEAQYGKRSRPWYSMLLQAK